MAQRSKRYEELTFADDFMFCTILQNEQDLCKELVEIILDRKIGEIVKTEEQKRIEITADGHGVRFDVYMEDDKDSVYDIEMQKTDVKNLPRRTRYYQGMFDLNQMKRGIAYEKLKKSVIIFICLENPFAGYGYHKYSFHAVCREVPGLELDDGASRILLSTKGDKKDISAELQALLDYIAGKAPESDFTRRLDEQVKRYREHKERRTEYMTLLERDEMMREEGREEVRAEERAKTEAETKRADAAEERIRQLEKLLEEYKRAADQ